MNKRYKVITDGRADGGFDEKLEYQYMTDAIKSAKAYLKDEYDGVGIYDNVKKLLNRSYGNFRVEHFCNRNKQ